MSNIRIVTDSTADLTPELVERYGIRVVPLEVLAEGKAYKDKIDITNEEYYEILRSATVLPTTSQPSPAVFAQTYRELAAEGAEHIISIQISSELSGTYQSSVLAAGLVADAVTVHNFDSRTATMGLGLIVLSAACMAKEGKSLDEILAQVDYMIQNSDLYFLLDSLDNLHKGGRIGKASHMVGSLLNIKPVLNLSNGVISAYEKVRGNKGNKALERLIAILAEKIDPHKKLYCTVGYCDNREIADYMVEKLKEHVDCDEFIYLQIGSVVATHIGMGAVGLAFYQLEA
ncbi:MAG: DegV family protein [Peptococcaceae bacterium]|nr:DegV family protein [Peptococcaceae bacterium]